MEALKCKIIVAGGLFPGNPIPELTREWNFTQKDLDNPPTYTDKTGAAMNYAMSLQNPAKINWVRFDWVWY